MKYGANPYQANSKGESPLDVAINDDIIKLLRKETVYKLVSDESDTPASSPESLLPKEGASELIPSASASTESSTTVSEQNLSSSSRLAEEAVRKPAALHQQPSAEYEAFRSGSGAISTLPLPAPSGVGGDQTVRSVSPVTQQSVPRPLSAGRPASTGFTQYGKSQVCYEAKLNKSFCMFSNFRMLFITSGKSLCGKEGTSFNQSVLRKLMRKQLQFYLRMLQ